MDTKENRSQYSAVFKLTLVGESGVGKSSMLSRFADDKCLTSHIATIGVDFKVRTHTYPCRPPTPEHRTPPQVRTLNLDNEVVKLQMWDTAGQERFRALTTYYRGAHGVILVYDVTRPKTFEQVERWRGELLERIDSPDSFPCVVFGNKTDASRSEEVALDRPAVLAWCRQRGIGHVETSAKDGTGVDAAMEAIALLAVENKRRRPRPEPDRSKIRLRSGESGDLGSMYSRHPTNSERCGCGSGGIAGAVD